MKDTGDIGMKYIVFSFDDGRVDTYSIALPIMKNYGLTGTVNVITSFINLTSKGIVHPEYMSLEQLLDWQNKGGEIACHGATHQNTCEDILKNIEDLNSMGINTERIGFASPTSWLTKENVAGSGILDLKQKQILSYLRSGIRIKREGGIYFLFSVIERYSHSKALFYILNKRCIINRDDIPVVYPSVAIKDYTTEKQVEFIIEKMRDDSAVILMFHSIVNKKPEISSHYCWCASRFEKLCEYLYKNDKVRVLTSIELENVLNRKNAYRT